MGVVDNLKDAVKLVQQIDNIELYRKILDLQADVQGLVDENRDLKEQIGLLTQRLQIKEALSFDGKRYWLTKDDKKEGPFCQVCWDIDGKLVRMGTYQPLEGRQDFVCEFCVRHRGK